MSLPRDIPDFRALICKGKVPYFEAKLSGQTRERAESLKGLRIFSLA
jgi:hypothetical protein